MILKLLVCVGKPALAREKEREKLVSVVKTEGKRRGTRLGGLLEGGRAHVAEEVGVSIAVRPRRSLASFDRCLRRGGTTRGDRDKVRFGRRHARFSARWRTHFR